LAVQRRSHGARIADKHLVQALFGEVNDLAGLQNPCNSALVMLNFNPAAVAVGSEP
jgi:hypothetical protein